MALACIYLKTFVVKQKLLLSTIFLATETFCVLMKQKIDELADYSSALITENSDIL